MVDEWLEAIDKEGNKTRFKKILLENGNTKYLIEQKDGSVIETITPKLPPTKHQDMVREHKQKKNLLQNLSEELDDALNWQSIAKKIIDKHPLFYDKTGMYWMWEQERQCYTPTDETDIMNIVDASVRRNTLRGGVKAQVVEAFKREGRLRIPKEPPKTWVQFKDKIFDVKTGEEFLVSAEYFLTNPIPHNLGDSEETPVIDKLLEEWGGEYKLTLKELIAYCLLRDYPIHRIFLLIGSGSNGKGTFLRLLNNFVGEKNIASAEMDMLISNQFHITKLHKKLCCQMSETNFSALKNTSMLKKLSGGDLIGFEYKNKLPFEDYNYAKVIIATNSLPSTHDKTDGFYRRWIIVDFNKQFDEKTDPLNTIPDYEFSNLARWCCKALQRLLSERKFHLEGSIIERKSRYESRSNPLKSFVEERYEKDYDEKVGASDFYDDFCRYLHEHGMRNLTYQVVRTMMKDEGFEYEKLRLPMFENPVACIIGLKRKEGVPAVPVVPAVSVRGYTRGTNPNVVERVEQPEQYINKTDLWLKFQEFIAKNPVGNAWMIDEVIGSDIVNKWKSSGKIAEIPAGTYVII